MRISDSHAYFELFVAATVLIRLGGGVCGEATSCRLDGLVVRLVDSDSESDGACGEALSCRLDGLMVRLADSPIQVRGR